MLDLNELQSRARMLRDGIISPCSERDGDSWPWISSAEVMALVGELEAARQVARVAHDVEAFGPGQPNQSGALGVAWMDFRVALKKYFEARG